MPDTSANFSIRFSVKKQGKPVKPPKRPHVQVLLERAEEWQRMLDAGEVKSRAEIGRRFGLSAGRVSNILNLLRLAPEIQQAIHELPLGTPRSEMSERGLRELARLPQGVQIAAGALKRFLA